MYGMDSTQKIFDTDSVMTHAHAEFDNNHAYICSSYNQEGEKCEVFSSVILNESVDDDNALNDTISNMSFIFISTKLMRDNMPSEFITLDNFDEIAKSSCNSCFVMHSSECSTPGGIYYDIYLKMLSILRYNQRLLCI